MLFLKVLSPKQYDCVFNKQSIGSRSENEPDWFQLEATYYKLVFNCPLTVMSSRKTREETPSRASHTLIESKWVKKFFQAGSKSFD